MSKNKNEFLVTMTVQRNDTIEGETPITRQIVAESGCVDVNETIEDMIDSIKGIENF